MEPVFENQYHSKHRMLAEFFRKYTIGPHPVLVAIVAVMFVLLTIVRLCAGIFADDLPTWLMMAVALFGMYFLADLYAWISLRHTKKQNDGVLPVTRITFDEKIELYEGMVHITLEYRKIVKVVHLTHSYALLIGKRNGVIMDPDGFTKGTFAEFKQFLREQRPDLQIPE